MEKLRIFHFVSISINSVGWRDTTFTQQTVNKFKVLVNKDLYDNFSLFKLSVREDASIINH